MNTYIRLWKYWKVSKNKDYKPQNPWYYNFFNEERQGTRIWMVRYEELRGDRYAKQIKKDKEKQ